MLKPEERAEIEEELDQVPSRRAACIGALVVVQRRRGYVDDEALADVAEFLGMSEAELDAVASFYNLVFRKPVGRHVILICDSVSCWILGCDRLRRSLSESIDADLGQTSPDGRFTLLPMACLGACERGPAFMVDEDLYGEESREKLQEILHRYQ